MSTSLSGPDGGATRSPWLRRTYLAILGVLILLAIGARLVAPASDAATLALVLAFLWAVPLAVWAVRRLWRKLTYRVGVRLFISYLLIGLTPFALLACLALVAGYVLVGQYTAARVGTEMDQLSAAMAARAAAAVRELTLGRAEHAREILENSSEKERGMHQLSRLDGL